MSRLSILPAVILVLSLGLATFACNGDDEASPTPTVTPVATPSPQASPASTSTPTATSVATPSPDASPSSPVRSAIRITPPEDRGEFVDQLEEQQMLIERCTYDAATGSADCGASGLYELDPPPPEGEVECSVYLAEGEPVAVSCASGESAVSLYEIP